MALSQAAILAESILTVAVNNLWIARLTVRKHGPVGYENYSSYKPWLRDEFDFRCAYCLIREPWYPNGQDSFGVDHFVSRDNAPDLACDYSNLVYACNRCNSFKGNATRVLNPCKVSLSDHIKFLEDGNAAGLTSDGNIHISLLDLNDPDIVRFRRTIITLIQEMARNIPDSDGIGIEALLGFPEDLPNLMLRKPSGGNNRKAGIHDCRYEQRKRGALPLLY